VVVTTLVVPSRKSHRAGGSDDFSRAFPEVPQELVVVTTLVVPSRKFYRAGGSDDFSRAFPKVPQELKERL